MAMQPLVEVDPTITLALLPCQAQILAHALSYEGAVRLTVRSLGDDAAITLKPTTRGSIR
jgi:hypothetical protein